MGSLGRARQSRLGAVGASTKCRWKRKVVHRKTARPMGFTEAEGRFREGELGVKGRAW